MWAATRVWKLGLNRSEMIQTLCHLANSSYKQHPRQSCVDTWSPFWGLCKDHQNVLSSYGSAAGAPQQGQLMNVLEDGEVELLQALPFTWKSAAHILSLPQEVGKVTMLLLFCYSHTSFISPLVWEVQISGESVLLLPLRCALLQHLAGASITFSCMCIHGNSSTCKFLSQD